MAALSLRDHVDGSVDSNGGSSFQSSPQAGKQLTVARKQGAFWTLIALVALSCVVHGYLDGRWTVNANLNDQGKLLSEIPEQIGDWKLTGTKQLDPKAEQLLRCFGSVVREYTKEGTSEVVNVAIMFGPRGPIAVHTPEVCYSSVGTEIARDRKVESLDVEGQDNSLWSVQFADAVDALPSLDVWYAWSDGGPWEAREQPRFWLTETLYKIQVAGPVGEIGQRPVEDFLTAFLPVAGKAVR
ncbi:exosortase-associated EpsI family protein [Rubripirellula reticaptiva]|uniref:Methanolan biosynthesis EpsI domain-containing protein n=1 Tax=Rubripirellula reticaptiva TaxID=2528013 RepID=A0A5C6F1H4_9BACT|nr:exosortase-associated EpsI family protein [Rubripirellula reticaptiva]TWU55693.1 hypothetical protein Poly59_19930 [Rubripirellula reticaptiva]